MANTAGVEQGVEIAVALDQEVLGATADPEEAEIVVDGGRLGVGDHHAVGGGRGGAEGPDPVESVVVLQGDGQSVVTAHGESGKGARIGFGDDAVGGFHEGDDVLDEFIAETLGIEGGVLVESG